MSGFLIAMIYLTVWWLVLFMVLPIGITSQQQTDAGHASGAPDKASLGIKLAVTTVLTGVVTWLIVTMIDERWIVLA